MRFIHIRRAIKTKEGVGRRKGERITDKVKVKEERRQTIMFPARQLHSYFNFNILFFNIHIL